MIPKTFKLNIDKSHDTFMVQAITDNINVRAYHSNLKIALGKTIDYLQTEYNKQGMEV